MEDMISDLPSSSNETSDRISQLPEHIILRILFFLPAKDAARSSILSKTWLPVWKSLPIFSFSSDTFSHKANLLKQDASFDAEADGYMDLIEKSLEKLRHHKVRIERFQLDLFKSHERHYSQFNQFMELANRNQIEKLVVHGLVSDQNQERPSLPLATFASTNSFRVLDLKNSVLTPEILKDEPRFPCLRKLSLFRVELSGMDQMLENMLANCPLLKNFSLIRCRVEHVKLVDHPKLNDVMIQGVPSIRIEAKSLENFHCVYRGNKPLELHLVSCENLQKLNLCTRFTSEYIQEMVAKSPLLRTLILSPYISLERLKISSPSLLVLVICAAERGVDEKEIEIDAPNLERYRFSVAKGRKAATPVFINSARLQIAELSKHLFSPDIPSQWFIHLMNCLPSFEYNVLRISVWHDMLQRVKLIPRQENPACCRNSQRKCWQHYLDDVKPLKAIKMKDDKYVWNCHDNGIALTSSQVEISEAEAEAAMEDMILDSPSSSNETSDRISQLPEHIILRILFFLPAEDAARSSILSKTLLSVWKSLPIFSFSTDAFSRKENLLKQDVSFDAEADGYMDLIDKSLEKLRHHKVRIERYQLDLFKSHERHVSRFNKFMELTNRNQVEKLVVHGLVSDQNQERPSLPLATFASTNSFSLLDLKDVVLTPEILKAEPRFPCLQELSLLRVELSEMDQMLENMLANCPLLKNFSLKRCGVKHVKLVDHPKLNIVTIQGVPCIRIEAKSLKKIYCEYTRDKPLELHLVSCENLQVLNLHTRFTSEYIQEMVAKSPLLRTLILSPYISLERLKISSPSLVVLVICAAKRGVDEKEIEIDAPNLKHYRYSVAKGKTAATPIFINTAARLQVAVLSKCLSARDIPSQWFIHLMNCLLSFEYNVLRICVWHNMTNKDTVLENLRQISVAPPVYLDVLLVIVCRWPFDFAAFFDCCFWICRPRTIIIKTSCENNAELEDQLECGKLIPWEENPACCINSQRKCWQHYLDDVKTLKAIKMKDDNYVRNCHAYGIVLTSSEVELIAIHLEWKMTGQKRNHRWVSSQNLFKKHGFQFIF
ncbi:hypothetical protein GQ457_14G006610 [Hibiscus cannabinus]